MLRGARGKRLVFGSLYAPTERSSDAAKENDKEKEKEMFWSDVMAALEEIGLKERDVLVLAADINGETDRQVRDDAKEDEVDAVQPAVGRWGVGTQNDNGRRLVDVCEQRG
jgi:hypothetical protein